MVNGRQHFARMLHAVLISSGNPRLVHGEIGLTEWIRRLRAKIGTELTFVTSAGGWVEDEARRVLLQRRERDGSVWGFPGGVMDLGEAAHETAIREVREETGLEVEVTGLIGVYSKFFVTLPNGDQCQSVCSMFRMRPTGGTLTVDNVETYELRFFEPAEMPRLYSAMHRQVLADMQTGPGPFYR